MLASPECGVLPAMQQSNQISAGEILASRSKADHVPLSVPLHLTRLLSPSSFVPRPDNPRLSSLPADRLVVIQHLALLSRKLLPLQRPLIAAAPVPASVAA